MAAKLLVYVTPSGAAASLTRGGKVGALERFANDETGLAAFRDYAAASAGTPAFILVDATEEDYRFETLPHASGSDRDQMVERKLRQYYRSSPYCMAQLVGRDSTKRRDDRFLFCALTNPDVVTPWLDTLAALKQPVGGVYLLPLVLRRLVPDIAPKVANLITVGVMPSGIRLAFFRDGAFRLSRLSRADLSAETLPRAITEEISNTRLYLHALRAATLDEPVTVALLDLNGQLSTVKQQVATDIPGVACELINGEVIAEKIKLDAGNIAADPEIAYLQLLADRMPSSNLAKPDITLGYRRLRIKQNLYAASIAAGIAGLCWSGFNLSQQFTLNGERDDVVRQTARVNAEYEAATRQFPSAPTSAENLRRTTELAEKLRASDKTPLAFLASLSRALGPDADLAVVEVLWQHSPNEIAGPDRGNYQPQAGGAAPPPPPPPPVPGAGGSRKQSGLLSGEIRNFRGDYRNAINRINALAERLRGDPSVEEVRVVQLPLNVSPGLAISGSTSDVPAQGGSTEFKLIVVMKGAAA